MKKTRRNNTGSHQKKQETTRTANESCNNCGYKKPHLHEECPMCRPCECEKPVMDCECKEGE